MKRFVWIIAAIWLACTAQAAAAAVQANDLPGECSCDCCDCHAGCEPSFCAPPLEPAPFDDNALAVTVRSEFVKGVLQVVSSFARETGLPTSAPARIHDSPAVDPPQVPLFCRHCAFLI